MSCPESPVDALSTASHAGGMETEPFRRPEPPPGPDAIRLLKDEHKVIRALFKSYGRLAARGGPDADKRQIALQICAALRVHAALEDELLYPAARQVLDPIDEDLIDEASVEHAGACELIAQIEASSPRAALFDTRVRVLGECIAQHMKEEEAELFPLLRRAGLDLCALGAAMLRRRLVLRAESWLDRPAVTPVSYQ